MEALARSYCGCRIILARFICNMVNSKFPKNYISQIKAVSAKVSRAIGFLKHAKSFLPKETCKLSIQALWSLIFDTAVLSGAALVQVKLISYKNFKSVLLG